MLSRKDFPSPTTPLYGSGFSQKKVEPPDFATVKDFFRFYIQACTSHTSVYLTGVHLTGVHLTGVHLIGVHLMSMCLMGVYLTGVTSRACI
jgi:hypothetical protein